MLRNAKRVKRGDERNGKEETYWAYLKDNGNSQVRAIRRKVAMRERPEDEEEVIGGLV